MSFADPQGLSAKYHGLIDLVEEFQKWIWMVLKSIIADFHLLRLGKPHPDKNPFFQRESRSLWHFDRVCYLIDQLAPRRQSVQDFLSSIHSIAQQLSLCEVGETHNQIIIHICININLALFGLHGLTTCCHTPRLIARIWEKEIF